MRGNARRTLVAWDIVVKNQGLQQKIREWKGNRRNKKRHEIGDAERTTTQRIKQ